MGLRKYHGCGWRADGQTLDVSNLNKFSRADIAAWQINEQFRVSGVCRSVTVAVSRELMH
jgi:hypothetical protein